MQKRIILLVVVSILIVLASLGVISVLSVNKSIGYSLDDHLTISTIIGKNIEFVLERNISRLYDLSLSALVDIEDGDWEPEKKALKTAYDYSIFTDGIYLLDIYGNVVLSYPHKEDAKVNLMGIPFVNQTITERKTVVSNVYTITPSQKKVIFVFVPLKNRAGEVVGAAGGEIDPANYMFTRIIESVRTTRDSVIELIDSHGIIISSNDRTRILKHSDHNKYLGNLIAGKKSIVGTCHRCHEESSESVEKEFDMLAFVPLSSVSWGVCVREPKDLVFAPATELRRSFIAISLIFVVTGLVLAIGLSKSIVRPIRLLIDAAYNIGRGNLKEPLRLSRNDEIGVLATEFDKMREKLDDSLERISKYNVRLEHKVLERTEELLKNKAKLAALLNELICAQEDERKRIARELHDETSQSLAALGMSLEIAALAFEKNHLSKEMILELRERVRDLMRGIGLIIQDLRPTVLDDLGFVSAVRWLLEKHLSGKGGTYRLNLCERLTDESGTLMDANSELRLFRIIQEAVINISKYAKASIVSVEMECTRYGMEIDIIDNGRGFDVDSVLNSAGSEDGGGFGLLGMKEHVDNLEGTLTIMSEPGGGTHINISVPLRGVRFDNVKN